MVEFKESADKSLASEVCAFANASGGRVFIGVDDDGKIVGTDTCNTARSRIQDTINQIEPRLFVDIAVYENIIVINVPEGTDKPYSCAKGFYLRSGPNSQKLERNGIIDFLQTEGRVIYDSIIDSKHPITNNFNEAEYLRYLRMAGISDVLPRESVLKNLICAGITDNGCLSYTNAGLLFFRDNTQEIFFDFAHVICALYKGTNKVDIMDAKVLNGSIIENIDNAMIFLKRNLRMRYEIKSVRRKEILELPEDALREAVTNAVCHRDYFEKGARVMVEIFDDRVEITNPGGAPKGITTDNFGSMSVTRNPIIASLLHRAHYIERMGTGILRMTQAMETAGLKIPLFQTKGYFFKIIFERDLSLPNSVDVVKGTKSGRKDGENVVKETKSGRKDGENVVKETKSGRKDDGNVVKETKSGRKDNENVVKETKSGWKNNGNVVKETKSGRKDNENGVKEKRIGVKDAKEAQTKIIDLVKGNRFITIPQIALLLNISLRQTYRLLKSLTDNGTVTRTGGRKQGYWQVNTETFNLNPITR